MNSTSRSSPQQQKWSWFNQICINCKYVIMHSVWGIGQLRDIQEKSMQNGLLENLIQFWILTVMTHQYYWFNIHQIIVAYNLQSDLQLFYNNKCLVPLQCHIKTNKKFFKINQIFFVHFRFKLDWHTCTCSDLSCTSQLK